MNQKVRNIIKNAIEENPSAFKVETSKALYEKVGKKLQEKYVETSKKIFEAAEQTETPEPEVAGGAGVSAIQYSNRDYSVPTPPAPKGASMQWKLQWRWLHQNWNNQELWNSTNRTPAETARWMLNNIS